MLKWFRVRAPQIAATIFASLMVVGGAAITPHEDDCHGAVCSWVVIEHDASAHRIEGPSADPEHAQHCLVCHWARSFRPQTEARIVTAPAADAGIPVQWVLVPVARRTQVAQPPLRSPPPTPVS